MPLVFRIEETSSKFFRLQMQSLVTKHVMVDQKESLVAAKGRARLKHNLREDGQILDGGPCFA